MGTKKKERSVLIKDVVHKPLNLFLYFVLFFCSSCYATLHGNNDKNNPNHPATRKCADCTCQVPSGSRDQHTHASTPKRYKCPLNPSPSTSAYSVWNANYSKKPMTSRTRKNHVMALHNIPVEQLNNSGSTHNTVSPTKKGGGKHLSLILCPLASIHLTPSSLMRPPSSNDKAVANVFCKKTNHPMKAPNTSNPPTFCR